MTISRQEVSNVHFSGSTEHKSLCLRDVENQQEVGEQTLGLRREMFTENIES